MGLRVPSPIKKLFQFNGRWWTFYQKHRTTLRPAIVDNVIAMLSCGLTIRGFAQFACSNPSCTHTKKVPFSCKSRLCPTCGKKATDQWIARQQAILPETPWQHITFTLPDSLWQLIKHNRYLLNDLSRLAAGSLLKTAGDKGILPGIFTALHTFGRDLKWNVHIHLSVTRGGLTNDHEQWKSMYFRKSAIMPMWRYAIVTLLRNAYDQGRLTLPPHLQRRCPTRASWNAFLDQQYQKHWHVHFAKPSKNAWHTIGYLGKYLKRPPLSQSRLEHYDGNRVIFNFLNHRTGNHETRRMDDEAFIGRFVQHIPDKGFRMIRYYGFMANRVRSALLPKVYALVNQPDRQDCTIHWPKLQEKTFHLNPLECILCRSPMRLQQIVVGRSAIELHPLHEPLARMKQLPVL